MAGFDVVSYAASNKYTDETVEGGGALKGKNCVVESIEKIEGYTRVHFKWTLDDGTVQRQYTDVPDGQKGDRGDRGAIGPQGIQGIQGVQGETGLKGDQGIQGIQGIQGPQGIQGIQGEKGDDGYPFLIYKQYDDISEFNASDFPEVGLMFMVMTWDVDPVTGDEGYPVYRFTNEGNPPYSLVIRMNTQGIKGEKGDKGDTGAQGPQGIQGEQGEKGEKGEKGDTGAQGIQGEQGIGLPDGGNTGDVLVKYSSSDYDFDWKGTTDRVQPGNTGLVESQSVYSAIQTALSSIYTPRGDLTCAELTSSLLIEANVGNVYEMTDTGTTTALFLQGEGETISIGANVGIINAGEGRILFNLMPGAFDLSDYQKKDLTTPLVIGGTSQATVEGALGGLNDISVPRIYYNPDTLHTTEQNRIDAIEYILNNLIDVTTFVRPRKIEATVRYNGGVYFQYTFNADWESTNINGCDILEIGAYNKIIGTWMGRRTNATGIWAVEKRGVFLEQSNFAYSTSEINTGATWIDGKPIYRKVVEIGVLPNATTKTVAHGISNLGRVIHLYGTFVNSPYKWATIPWASTGASTGNNISCELDSSDVKVTTGVDRTMDDNCYVIIEYTKTTD